MTDEGSKRTAEEAFLSWSNVVKKQTQEMFVKSIFTSIIEASVGVEKFVSWYLGALSIVFSFTFINIDKVLLFFSRDEINRFYSFLILAILFAFVAKAYSYLIELKVAVSSKITQNLSVVLADYERQHGEIEDKATALNIIIDSSLDKVEILNKILEPYSFLEKYFLKKSFYSGVGDSLLSHKLLIVSIRRRSYVLFLSIFCLMTALFSIVKLYIFEFFESVLLTFWDCGLYIITFFVR